LRTLATYLPAIACGAMMLLICIPMMRNMHKSSGGSDDSDTQREIGELRDEVARLKAERALEDKSETVDG
jgi:hypothetical protein